MKNAAFHWLVLALLAGGVFAANWTKPVHMDDTAYLAMAQSVLQYPAHPMSTLLNWGETAEPIATINQPLLIAWLMAGLMALAGPSLLWQHALISAFGVAAVLIFHRLARRRVPAQALWLTALLALGPAFLPAQNLMVDLPLLALWLAFFLGLEVGRTSGRTAPYGWACGALAAACLVKYTSLVLLPIFVLVVLWRRHWRALGWLTVPLAVLSGWSLFNWFDYGGIHLLQRGQRLLPPVMIAWRAVLWIGTLGAVAPFSVALFDRSRGRLALLLALWAVVIGVLTFWFSFWLSDSRANGAWWGLFCANGLFLCLLMAAQAVPMLKTMRQADFFARWDTELILLLWIGGTFAFVVLFAPFIAARHVLLILPALLLLLGPHCGGAGRRWIALGLTALLGGALALSDHRQAAVYRDAAPALMRTLPAGTRVWQTGHWGWQYYAGQAGMLPYDTQTTELRPGDILIEPEGVTRQQIRPADRARLVRIEQRTIPSTPATWLRAMSYDLYGGLYATVGLHQAPPWQWTRKPLEVFVINRVRPVQNGTANDTIPESARTAEPARKLPPGGQER